MGDDNKCKVLRWIYWFYLSISARVEYTEFILFFIARFLSKGGEESLDVSQIHTYIIFTDSLSSQNATQTENAIYTSF